MPFYQRQGSIPRKRHTAFRKPDHALYYEEHMSREGFSGAYSNIYHLQMPTRILRVGRFLRTSMEAAGEDHRPRHIRTGNVPSGGDLTVSRRMLFFNEDVALYKAHPTESSRAFSRNGHSDELIYVQRGKGVLETQFGELSFLDGDYLLIPRGVIYRLQLEKAQSAASMLVIESAGPIRIPAKYRGAHGQMLEHAPYCERDIRIPMLKEPNSARGEFQVMVKLQDGIQELIYDVHPFDVVGWDGCHYPWALSIRDFEPVVGSLHQPPPVHQTFEGTQFVICSFVSRPFDFHPDAIPAPYPHSNLDSDEILFYSEGEFMSRKGIEKESITYHPMGMPHGPQPGRYEESIGKKATSELAVMVDTFRPLRMAPDAKRLEDPGYALSWGAGP